MLRLLVSLVALALYAGSAVCQPLVLRVGIYASAPKEFIDAKGQPSGILVELLREIAKKEDWTLVYVPCEWEQCVRALQGGEIDLLPDVAYSEQRAAQFEFHQTPAMHSWSEVYRHRDVPIRSMLDLAGKRVAIVQGSIQAAYFAGLKSNFGLNTVVVPAGTVEDAFRLVEQRKADAVIVNKDFGNLQARRMRLVDTQIVFQPSRLFYAAAKGQQRAVLGAIDRHLQAWQANPDSVYFQILRRWHGDPEPRPIPTAFWLVLGAILLLLVSALLIAAWLRQQVREKTRDLRDSERTLSTILDSVDSLIYIKDASYRYRYVNQAACRLLDKPLSDILGKSDFDLFDQGTAALLLAKDRRVIEGGERLVAEDGIPAQTHCDATYLSTRIPLTRDDGSVYALCGMATDITERKRAEESLRIAATVFQSQQGMFVTGPDRLILEVNHAYLAMTGFDAAELAGRTLPGFSLEPDSPDFRAEMWQVVARSGKWQGPVWTRRADGDPYPAWLTVTAVDDADGNTSNYVGTQTDITLHKLAQDEIMQLAYYDPLTGLPNRRLLLERLQHCLASCKRSRQAAALLFVDLDNFKDLNDTGGHALGDQLLRQVGRRIVSCTREGDTVARLGGDEFVVLLEGVGGGEAEAAEHAATIGWKILHVVGEPYAIDGATHHATCSIGVALRTDEDDSSDDLMKRGDLAMYQAKKDGRNTLRFFNRDMQAAVMSRIALEREMRDAIENGQFVLHYQGQTDGHGRLTGAEALLRWQHPQRGLVGPNHFIGIAESSGLILPLGDWVLRTACRQLAQWSGAADTAALTMAVNVSVRQFRQPDFVSRTLAILDETGADAGKLKLELTESVLIENVEDTIAKMRRLKERGIGFSLDDFGTGYSSLSYLKRLPLDQLKIDRSFVRDVLVDANDATIARSIVALAKSLGLGIIAEGVETQAQCEFLARIGCEAYQGYLFSRPVAAPLLRQLAASAAV